MNLIFHIAAAVATIWVCHRLIVLQRQRDMLRSLMAPRRLMVAPPASFIRTVAASAGLPVVDGGGGEASLPPVRIDPRPWGELLSATTVSLLRWTGPSPVTLSIELASGCQPPEGLAARLEASLGGTLRVQTYSPGQAERAGSGG